MTLTGKQIVVLGGTSGIGLAVAQAAAREGARLTIASSSAARVSDALRSMPPGTEGRALDLTGGFENRFRGLYDDQAFFIKAYLHLTCFVNGETLDLYRQHGGSHCARALRAGRYSTERPSAALADLNLWCALYFARARVRDVRVWSALLAVLRGIGVYWIGAAASALGHGANRAIGAVAGLRHRRRGSGERP